MKTKCKGTNCNAIDGVGHSAECIKEHDELCNSSEMEQILQALCPTKVTRNGKTYYEYTPQELEERRLNNLIDERIASGYVWRQKESIFHEHCSTNTEHRRFTRIPE